MASSDQGSESERENRKLYLEGSEEASTCEYPILCLSISSHNLHLICSMGAMPNKNRQGNDVYLILSYCRSRETCSRSSLVLPDVQVGVWEVKLSAVSGLGRVHMLRVSGQPEASTTEGKAGIPG